MAQSTAATSQDSACRADSILYPGADSWLVQLADGSVRTPTDEEVACLQNLENDS